MDTKSKSIKYSMIFKFSAFLLIVASIVYGMLLLMDQQLNNADFDSIFVAEYENSRTFLIGPAQTAIDEVMNALEND